MRRLLSATGLALAIAACTASAAGAAVPGAPTGVAAAAGNGKATVTWHAVAAAPAITGYTVTAAPGGATCTTTGALTCTVNGLTNGTSYFVSVTATNADGTGPPSAVAAVTPATVPGTPTNVTATAGNTQATVTWTAPASTGGATITQYVVTASGGGGQTCTWSSGALTCAVTGLVNGAQYTFTVVAQNRAGTGAASATSNAIMPIGAPPSPTGASATAGDQQATVNCTAPVTNGGATITSYTATASPGGARASAPSCPITVTGLTDGTAYTFTVTVTNTLGTSPPSTASNAVTPVDTHPPSAPTALSGKFPSTSLVLSWRASTDNVGVDHYEILFGGAPLASVSGGATTASVHAFNPHGSSVYTVTAFDARGNQSGASNPVVVRPTPPPKGVRSAPAWAWKLLAWQLHGQKGARPKTPKPIPPWYATWKNWRLHPFQVVS